MRQWDAHLSQILALPRLSLPPAAISSCVTWMESLQGIQGKIYVNFLEETLAIKCAEMSATLVRHDEVGGYYTWFF